MAEVHRNVCTHALRIFYARSVHFQHNVNHFVPSRGLVEYGDISPQVFLCIDVPQNVENIYCLLFIMSLVAVFQLVLVVCD